MSHTDNNTSHRPSLTKEEVAHVKREERLEFVADFSGITSVLGALIILTVVVVLLTDKLQSMQSMQGIRPDSAAEASPGWVAWFEPIGQAVLDNWGWVVLGAAVLSTVSAIVHVKIGEGRGWTGSFSMYR